MIFLLIILWVVQAALIVTFVLVWRSSRALDREIALLSEALDRLKGR